MTAIFNNATEVHIRYPSVCNDVRLAVESDIHETGNTYDIREVESVKICKILYKRKEF